MKLEIYGNGRTMRQNERDTWNWRATKVNPKSARSQHLGAANRHNKPIAFYGPSTLRARNLSLEECYILPKIHVDQLSELDYVVPS